VSSNHPEEKKNWETRFPAGHLAEGSVGQKGKEKGKVRRFADIWPTVLPKEKRC